MTQPRSLLSPARQLLPLAVVLELALAPAAALAYELHIECGSSINYVAQDGTLYVADRLYTPGGAGYLPDSAWAPDPTWHPIGGTPDNALYTSTRNGLSGGTLEYRFDLPNGDYLVTLHFEDPFSHSTGELRFDVLIEGLEVFSNIDLYALVERTYAIDFRAAATVADGQLNVVLRPDFRFVTLAAISVESRAPDALAPAAPPNLTAADNYLGVALDWDSPADDDVAGYRVLRSSSPGGPFNPVTGGLVRVSRFMDPLAAGGPWYYQVAAVDAYGNEGGPSPVVAASSLPHSATALPIAEVIIDPDSLEILNDLPTSDIYVQCDASFDGTVFPDALCRYRGNVIRSLLKKSWKIKLESGLYLGRDNFNLNSEMTDKSLLRERLSYEVLARNGCPSPRARFAHMIVNNQWMGARTDVENVDAQFLERQGLATANANLYKVGDNLKILPYPAAYAEEYEKEMGTPGDYSDLIAFIEGINLTSADSMFHYLAARLDLNRFLDFYSTQAVLQNTDTSYKNWFLHHDLATDRWTLIPWDTDLTWGNIWMFTEPISTTQSIFLGSVNRLFRWVQLNPMLAQLHFDRIRQILASTFTEPATSALIDSAYAAVLVDGERDWWKWGWERNDWFHAGPNELRTFVTGRTTYLNAQIASLEQRSALCINEFMASNATAVIDEWGDHDDWIEILNRGTAPAGLLGLYLTDDLTLPGRFALPDTTLNPGERAIVWADAEPYEGPWHATFRLEQNGEKVGLFSGPLATSAPIDVMVFDAQYTDAACGRLPDGSPYWQVLPTPTPGTANVGGGNIRPQITDVVHFPGAPPAGEPVAITARIWDDGTLVTTEVLYDAGAGFVTVPLRDDGLSGDGAAGDGLYGGTIPGQPANTTVLYYARAVDNLGAETTDPQGAPGVTHTFTTGYVPPPLKLNEFMAANDTTIADEHGDFDDWVEIWNAGPDTLALGGMHLTDNIQNPTKWIFPPVSLAPGGYLLVWCDSEPFEGPLHATFKLDAAGEELGLFDTAATGVGLIDTLTFGLQAVDVSFGRLPDGGNWVVLPQPSPGGTNGEPSGISGGAAPPRVLALRGPIPNPFNPSAAFELALPSAGRVRMVLHDVAGRRVRTLLDAPLAPGVHRLVWDGRDDRGRDAPSGVYWLGLDAAGEQRTVRAVLLR